MYKGLNFLRYENDNRKEHQGGLVEMADDQKDSQCFQPSVCSVEGLRMLVTKDINWEVKENPFLYPAQQRSDAGLSNHASELDGGSMHHMLEIFRFEVFIEQMTTETKLQNLKDINGPLHRQDLLVYPKQTRTSIDLPMIIINLSIPTVYILMSLVKIWSSSEKSVGLSAVKLSLFQCK